MECLRSSQIASSTSCSLRCRVRSWVRNRFLASCCVSVEPPCETPRCRTLVTARAQDADGIDAVMRIEAAVLDGDERLRQIGRQILQRDIGAGHFAALRQHAAVDADDLDGRRPLWEFPATGSAADARRPRSRRRPRRSPPTGRAPRPNRTAGRCRARPRDFDRRLAPPAAARGLRSARRLVVVIFGFALGGGFLRLVVVAAGNAVLRRSGADRQARRQARIAAPCARRSFSFPTPYANAAHTRPAAR